MGRLAVGCPASVTTEVVIVHPVANNSANWPAFRPSASKVDFQGGGGVSQNWGSAQARCYTTLSETSGSGSVRPVFVPSRAPPVHPGTSATRDWQRIIPSFSPASCTTAGFPQRPSHTCTQVYAPGPLRISHLVSLCSETIPPVFEGRPAPLALSSKRDHALCTPMTNLTIYMG